MNNLKNPTSDTKKAGWLRSSVFNLYFYFITAVYSIIAALVSFLSSSHSFRIANAWAVAILSAFKQIVHVEYDVKGLENLPEEPCLIASKHQSTLDCLLLYLLMPKSVFISKLELFFVPFFGISLFKTNTIFLRRKGGTASFNKLIKDCKDRISRGYSIIVFPEGTRTATGTKSNYKSGISLLCSKLDVPCVPVAMNSGKFWPRRSWMRNSGTFKVRILPAIKSNMRKKEFMAKLENDIETEMKNLI